MQPLSRFLLCLLALVVIATFVAYWYASSRDEREPSKLAFLEHCASCHGTSLGGTVDGPSLMARLQGGEAPEQLISSVNKHHFELVETANFAEPMIKALALHIIERRQGLPSIVESHTHTIPEGVIRTKHHDFSVELITGVGKGPYSIEPLPDGRVLLVEKVRGLSIIGRDGIQGPLLQGTPEVWSEIVQVRGSFVALGSMLDVELHPDYVNNGWIYLSHSDRCQLNCGSPWPVTMVRVVRGRLEGNRWVDSEVIWSVHKEKYTIVPDGVAAGRLAFDQSGHLYVTVGGKSTYDNLHVMDMPYGKIHRVKDNGEVPANNPFWQSDDIRDPASSRNTVWSYGHRTTQGLTTDPRDGAIWSTEMGPRGGDEINLIRRGGNYGWPLYTNGLDYNADYVRIGENLGLDFELSATIQPIVDFTPAPSLSNFTFYSGEKFPDWQHDLLVGSLRAQTLFRVRIENGETTERERLLTRLGRIRDVETGADGLVYVLIEHNDTGSLLRLNPAD